MGSTGGRHFGERGGRGVKPIFCVVAETLSPPTRGKPVHVCIFLLVNKLHTRISFVSTVN